jgi:hypothetical protein
MGTQFAGDLGNALTGRIIAGLFGATISGLLLFYLFRSGVRNAFR